jgi:hypothetical protein
VCVVLLGLSVCVDSVCSCAAILSCTDSGDAESGLLRVVPFGPMLAVPSNPVIVLELNGLVVSNSVEFLEISRSLSCWSRQLQH